MRHLYSQSSQQLNCAKHSLISFDFQHVEYFEIVRRLVEEYRLLFIDWVSIFDAWSYAFDPWGLFNPPGVGPFDKDPDDNIPFTYPFDEDK